MEPTHIRPGHSPVRAAATIALGLVLALAPSARGAYPRDRPVVSILLGDLGERFAAAREAALGETALAAIGELAAAEHAAIAALLRESGRALAGAENDRARARAVLDSIDYDGAVARLVAAAESTIDARLAAPEARALRLWLDARWDEETARHGTSSRPGFVTYTVFATQYIGETNEEAAVPDRYVKFAARGWEHHPGYEGASWWLALDYADRGVDSARVWDVGPWNVDDNYWDPTTGPRPRRLFTDLARGLPEAEAAYYSGYNGGKDQYGRRVLNPAGCDLTPALAARLGLAYLENAWIDVTYWWELDPTSAERIARDPPPPAARGGEEARLEVRSTPTGVEFLVRDEGGPASNEMPRAAPGSLVLSDVAGRAVCRWTIDRLPVRIRWRGVARFDRRAPGGVYVATWRPERGAPVRRRLVLIR